MSHTLLTPGHVAVVTGAASGIGLALATAFAQRGLHVLLADVEDGALATAAARVQDGAQGRVAFRRCDVADADAVEALAAHAFATFGAVHVLCNNAGVTGRFAPVWAQTDSEWRWVFGVNVLGLANGARAFVPRMLAQGAPAHIVNTASEAGFTPRPYVGVYHASKFAAVGFTENLAQDLEVAGADIRVSMLCPGAVKTQVMQAARNRPAQLGAAAPPSDAGARWLLENYHATLARGMTPEAVADCVLDAIAQQRFYVFTHDDVPGLQLARAQAIAENRYPHVPAGLAQVLRGAAAREGG